MSVETQGAETPRAEAPRAGTPRARTSPVLDAFARNPHRSFRIDVWDPAPTAANKAARAMTLRRAGMPLPGADLLPWAPPSDDIDLQEAKHRLEDPLNRLVDRLLWFDLARDPAADVLKRALAEPVTGAAPYLALSLDALAYTGKGDETGLSAAVAHAIDQANLRILSAAATMHAGQAAPTSAPSLTWEKAGTLDVAVDPLRALSPATNLLTDPAVKGWTEGLTRWSRLATSTAFKAYVAEAIEALGDDAVTAEDVDTVAGGVLTRLGDLLVEELRAALIAGEPARVAALSRVAATGGLDRTLLALSMRRLAPLFEEELQEIEPLFAAANATVGDVGVYLGRLETLAKRWKDLDPRGLLGLGEMVDESLDRAARRFGNLSTDGVAMDMVAALWRQAAQIAGAPSSKERFLDRAKTAENAQEFARCHYCGTRESNIDTSAVLSGKRETGRVRNFNSTTIHYAIRRAIIPRCEQCTDNHEYYLSSPYYIWGAVGGAAVLTLFLFGIFDDSPRHYGGPRIEDLFCGGSVAVAVAAFAGGYVFKEMLASWITPAGGHRPTDAGGSRAMRELLEDNMGSITTDLRRDAFARVKR